jgi:predicted hydrocarbon binding protein/predicted regulator of Ras-like GTPase activity (Roadblock/LC7/MglB family)
MEDILADIGAVLGVTGCFVCDAEGQILASTLSDLLDERHLSTVGRTISQTTAGLVTARRRKIQEIDLLYSEGRIVVKPLREGCLCVLCTRNMNVPLLNLTVDVAARKLTEALKQEKEPSPPTPTLEPEAVPLDEVLHTVVDAYPDVVSPVMDFEQTLAEADGPTALNALGRRTGEAIYQRRYSNMRLPASIPQGLELVVAPAVGPFAIVSSHGHRLDVLACPFCRNLPSSSARCHFLAGFVQGLLNSIAGLEEVVVTESRCRAMGEDTCSFEALTQPR